MSDPLLKSTFDPRLGESWVPARFAQMRCDGGMGGCRNTVARAPRIIIPATPWALDIPPRRVWTTLHYCELHAHSEAQNGKLLLAVLSDQVKAQVEAVAKAKWPHGHKPDFDRARIEWMLVTTPEYLKWLAGIEVANRTAYSGVKLL